MSRFSHMDKDQIQKCESIQVLKYLCDLFSVVERSIWMVFFQYGSLKEPFNMVRLKNGRIPETFLGRKGNQEIHISLYA